MAERRKHLDYSTLGELLDQLPARVLLDRMPGPVLGAGPDGVLAYANPAATTMLGYPPDTLTGTPLPSLLPGHHHSSVPACLDALRQSGPGDVVDWLHADGFSIHTTVSTPLLLRTTDPYLMIQLTDVTELHWS